MSNLKKILALVLALVMSFSLVTVSSAAYADADEITAKYDEAIAVLSGLGVFNGRTEDSFDPQGYITRAEVAAIIYRVVTGDVADVQVGIYADYNKFDDVASTAWYAGYVNFCANAEYIKGVGNNCFAPNEKVTGYQALAMILRAVGYDKNGEFTGAGWMVQTAAFAQKLHITDTVDDITLGTAATREVIAELLFRTIWLVPQVTYTMLTGYNSTDSIYNGELNPTLGEATFGLDKTDRTEIDVWGRPGYYWTSFGTAFVVRPEAYKAAYTNAVTECDIAAAAFKGKDANVMAWVNAVQQENADGTVASFKIEAKDTLSYLGAQGRVFEVYKDRLVIIDTFLAKVTEVVDIRKDVAGHPMNDASLKLAVYDNADQVPTTITLTAKSNWNYAVDDMVLLNTPTVGTTGDNIVAGHGDVVAVAGISTVLGLAPSFTGAQTVIHYLADKHTIDGADYNDAHTFYLDAAGTNKTSYTWFEDLNGNLIGSAIIPTTYTFGAIKDIQWITQTGDFGYAQATMVLMDGTTTTVIPTKITDGAEAITAAPALTYTATTASLTDGQVAREYANNFAQYTDTDLFCIVDNGNGTVTLVDVESSDMATLFNMTAGAVTADVDPANAVVLGTGKPLVNANTQFLFAYDAGKAINVAYDGMYTEFTAYTGFYNIPNYAAGAHVDYVDVNKDGYAEYVYVNGAPAAATSMVLFYLDNTSHYYTTADGTTTFSGYVNGVAGTISTNATVGATVLSTLVPTGAAMPVNTLYAVKMDNGLATAVTAVTTTAGALAATAGYKHDAKYYNAALAVNEAVRVVGSATYTAKFDGDVLVVDPDTGVDNNEVVYDVTNTTRVIGELVQNKVYGANYIIHIVYNAAEADKDATEIYVFEILPTSTPSAGTTGASSMTINATSASAVASSFVNGTGASVSAIVVWEYRLAGTTTWLPYETEGAVTVADATPNTAAALTFAGFSGSVETYEVRAVVYKTAVAAANVIATSNTITLIG